MQQPIAELGREAAPESVLNVAASNPFTAYAHGQIDYYLNTDQYKLKHNCDTCFTAPDKTVDKWGKEGTPQEFERVNVFKPYRFGWFIFPKTNKDYYDWVIKDEVPLGRYNSKTHKITLNVELLNRKAATMREVLMHEIAHALAEMWHYYPEDLVKEYGRYYRTTDSHDSRWLDIARELGADVSEYGVKA